MKPTHDPSAARREVILRDRSLSLANRVLGGAGRASLVAYHLAPGVVADALTHGLSAAGTLVVACVADPQVPATVWGSVPLRVRLDITKEAPEPSVRITACAVHLLGTLEWLPEEVKRGYLADAGLHPRLVELAAAPGGRLGVIAAERVLLHDSSGVTSLALDGLAERQVGLGPGRQSCYPDLHEEWEARDLVGLLSDSDRSGLLAAAASGWDAAIPLAQGDTGGCSRHDGQVFCVDVDRTGVTLMSVESGHTSVTLFAFEQPADSTAELADRMSQLLGARLRARAGI